LLVVGGFVGFWGSYYGGYVRADYGDVTREVAALERPGDVVLLTGPWQAWYFDYYYPRSGGTLSHMVLPKDAPPALDAAEAIPQLEALSRANRRVWYVQAGLAQSDPTNLVERWLHERAWPAAREPHQNAVLSLFAFGEPERRRALSTVTYGEAVRLTGGWAEDAEVATGDVVKLSLTLEALRPLPQDLKASLRLVGADGQRTAVDFTLADRTSGEDVPTSRWTSGKSVVVRRGVLAPPSLGPQPYELRLVIYDPATLRPLTPATTGQMSAGGEAAIGDV